MDDSAHSPPRKGTIHWWTLAYHGGGSLSFCWAIFNAGSIAWVDISTFTASYGVPQLQPTMVGGLQVGQSVVGEGRIEGSIGGERLLPELPELEADLGIEMVTWCEQREQGHGENSKWVNDGVSNPPLIVVADGLEIILADHSPCSTASLRNSRRVRDPDNGRHRWVGYAKGDPLAFMASVTALEPLTASTEIISPGTLDEMRAFPAGAILVGLVFTIGPGAIGYFLFLQGLLFGSGLEDGWARSYAYSHVRLPSRLPPVISPGRSRGTAMGREFEISRAGWIGNGSLFPASTRLTICLDEAMNPLRVRTRARAVRRLVASTPAQNEQFEQYEAAPEKFLQLRGASPARYRGIFQNLSVGSRLLDLWKAGVAVALVDGRLELVFPGGEIEWVFERAIPLADAIEYADQAGWKELAAGFEEGQYQRNADAWTLTGGFGGWTVNLVYEAGEPGSTRIFVEGFGAWPAGLEIGPGGMDEPGLHTGNPVLDGRVTIRCPDPEAVATLLQDDDMTGNILAVVMEHGGRVADGRIEVRQPDLLLNPSHNLLADMVRLAKSLAV